MGIITTVDGLEMFPTQGGYVIRCDKCGTCFDGDVRRIEGPDKIRRLAREAGWTGPMTHETDQDRCPNCK
jgi:hypothetical protein